MLSLLFSYDKTNLFSSFDIIFKDSKVLSLNKQGVTTILTTHYLGEAEKLYQMTETG